MTLRYVEEIELASQLISTALLQDMEAVLESGATLDKRVQAIVRELALHILEQVYAGVNRHLSAHYQSSSDWRIERRPIVQFKTLFGPVEVESPYWSATNGPGGVRPMKKVMGVEGNRYSEAVDRALVDFGVEQSFERAAAQFLEHYGWKVERGTVLRQTHVAAGAAKAYVEERLASVKVPTSEASDVPSPETEPYVVELDGCDIRIGVLMTAEAAGRTDREPDEWVRVVQWQEVRTGLVRPLSEQNKHYVCLNASYPEVCQQLAALAHEQGLRQGVDTIGVGDGGNGLREELARHFEPFQYVLDNRHLETHFYETAEALGIEKRLRKPWVKRYMDSLWDNQVKSVLEQLNSLYERTKNDRLRCLINHLKRFEDAVDYGRFKDQGWPVGSGEVESAHRYVPQARLKIPGACWHPSSVNPMLALRVVRANQWWDDFWQWLHIQRKQQQAA